MTEKQSDATGAHNLNSDPVTAAVHEDCGAFLKIYFTGESILLVSVGWRFVTAMSLLFPLTNGTMSRRFSFCNRIPVTNSKIAMNEMKIERIVSPV